MTSDEPNAGVQPVDDWPGHQGGRVRTTELDGDMCGGLTFDDVLTILQSLEPTNEPLFVRVDGVRHALIVDKVVEIKRDDLSYSLGSPASREIYLHARLQVSSQPGGSLREQLDRMINKTGRGS